MQRQAPVQATMTCIIPNCTYVTTPGYDRFQQLALHMPICPNAYPKGDNGSQTQDKPPRPVATLDQMMAKIRSMAASARQPDTHTVRLYEAKQFPKKSTGAFATSTASLSSTLGPPTNQPQGLPLQGQANSQRVNESLHNINRLNGICNAHENGQLGQPITKSAIETTTRQAERTPDQATPQMETAQSQPTKIFTKPKMLGTMVTKPKMLKATSSTTPSRLGSIQ